GPYIGRFENAVSDYLGIEEGLAVCNGTVAIHLACLALGLRPGQDVIVPALTFVATANAITYCGARPVFADCDPATWNVTRESIEAAWTPDTAGVVAVHLYGLPAPMKEIAALCEERGAWLIEDCAQGFGAKIDGRCVGGFGDAASFSFFGNKIISTGEGGMVFVRDPQKRTLAKMLRGQGMDLNRRYWHPIVGYNYRMTNVAAAIGLGQVEKADLHLGERRRIAARYAEELRPLADEGLISLPVEPVGYHNVHWLFSITVAGGAAVRDRVAARLRGVHGVETRPFFVPMHKLPMYDKGQSLPHSEHASRCGLNLPTYTGLSDADLDVICDAITQEVYREARVKVAA
ncbi:MAG TPA: DegT/DnrJ/EryC1/StrS family aminotransferase, partial [Planctomycetaceae bacterium]